MKKRRRRSQSVSKLGYSVLRGIDDDNMPLPLYEGEEPDEMSWDQLKGIDVAYLVRRGWKFDKLMHHFNVDRMSVLLKIRRG